METKIVRTVIFLAQYAQIRNFTIKLYLRNIGFLVIICVSWVRESQQDIQHSKKTIMPQFMAFSLFWVNGPKYGNQLQDPPKR